MLAAVWVPEIALWSFLGFLAAVSWGRQRHYWNRVSFWSQAYRESPGKSRVQTRYAEACYEEMERLMKEGKDYSYWEREAFRMQEVICSKN